MTPKQIQKIKSANKIQTSYNGSIWFATWYANSSTLNPSVSLSGSTEEFVVSKVSEIIEKVTFEVSEDA